MFEHMMSLAEQTGLKRDGAVDRPEMDTARSDVPLDPDTREEMESLVMSSIPCRHKFTKSDGQQCLMYFDERGRATEGVLSEIPGGELLRLATAAGWKMKPSRDDGYRAPAEE